MSILDRASGVVSFADGTRIGPREIEDELWERLDGRTDAVIRLESREVSGGRLIPICTVRGGRVRAISLSVSAAAARPMRKSLRQRAFLLSKLGMADDCSDTDCVERFAMGSVTVCVDPRTGRAEARIQYDKE